MTHAKDIGMISGSFCLLSQGIHFKIMCLKIYNPPPQILFRHLWLKCCGSMEAASPRAAFRTLIRFCGPRALSTH